jgi:4-amino-4-deoxy-L-arabinose transferase-like glycosyltransferase
MLVKNPVQALNSASIDKYWKIQNDLPPVAKLWGGVVWLVSHRVFNDLVANRFGPILLVALLVALLYLMIAEMYGKGAGLFASVALMCLPRFFFHAHLAALDVPVAVFSFGLTFLFWKTFDRKSWAWGLLWGLVWGLAVAIKPNGAFTPIALVIWFVIFHRKQFVALILRLVLMGIAAVLTFFLVWPWLYYQTWARVMAYIQFNLNHYEIGQWYLGHYYFPPPWHYVFVMLWAVVPITVMVLFLAGMVRAGKGKRDGGLGWLLIINVIVVILPFILSSNYHHDDERLFMPVFPFLAALAGIGFSWLVAGLKKLLERIKRPTLVVPAALILGIALLTPQLVAMVGLYPHLLSYYSEGVGGLPGATRLGLETTYWNETYAAAIPYINGYANSGDSIWVEDKAVFLYYQKIGQLRPDVWFTSQYPESVPGKKDNGLFGEADWYIFTYRQSQYGTGGEKNYLPLQILETQKPVYQISYQGVPLMKIFGKLK